ncbi:shikimate dehydrogenase [Jeotgalibacillus marinus]|uniref:Shikimate dehydrogenase (NADP(+)) n=1 Tax=Jeotgalibacillus marinus TaxID=86667 RepID=A0ABV3PZI4_9BACL
MKILLGVIGYPIEQSKSPLMHNYWLKDQAIDGHYQAFEVQPLELKEAVTGMKVLGLSGWNVTIPFKEAIIPLLDQIDPAAKAIGAVNTVVVQGGQLIGKNTDGLGFVQSLIEKRSIQQIKQSSILIIGAGGAAKGIYYALSQLSPMTIRVTNRTFERAASLVENMNNNELNVAITTQEAQQKLSHFDIIINTTSVGMFPEIDHLPIDVSEIKQGALAVDIIYNPLKTRFLRKASENGADTLNGVGMFVHQGALAFKEWTGKKPNTEKAIKMIVKDQGGSTC